MAAPPEARAQTAATLTTLYTFSGGNDGSGSFSVLAQGSDGNFYGTTYYGGANGDGTVYRITPAGALTTLYTFGGSDGSAPEAGLVQGSNGNFYGSTTGGGANGYGTIFEITPAGALTTLYTFSGSDGDLPNATLLPGSDGNFYGTTYYGGTYGFGTVFRMTPAGALTTLHSFGGSDGANLFAGLALGSDGNFYGTTQYGGSSDYGTVFRLTPAGALTTLYNFSESDGSYPDGTLVQGADGNFYGTVSAGVSGNGAVFRVSPAGAFVNILVFDGNDGATPYGGLILGSDGNFYGTTAKGGANGSVDGTLFGITPAGALTTLYDFSGTDGELPYAKLVLGTDGNFYGTTTKTAPSGGGTVFKLSLPNGLPDPGSVQLSAATTTVAESAGSVTLSVTRAAGSNGNVSVNYATVDDSAKAGIDYQAVSGTLSWADGDTSAKTISVPIIDRQLSSGTPGFLVGLSQPVGGVVLGAPTQEAVTILDSNTTVEDIQSVSLLSPPTNVTITQNQPVILYADVQALSGTLANVELFAIDSAGNAADLGGFTSERGQKTWQPTAPGDYTLQVVATDTQGNTQQATNPIHVLAAAAVGALPQANLYGALDGLTVALNDTVPVVAQAVDSDGNPLQNVQFYVDGVLVSSSPVGNVAPMRRPAGVPAASPNDAGNTGSLYQALVQLTNIQQLVTVVGTTASGVSSISKAATLYSQANAGTPPTAIISNLASGASVPTSAGQSVSVAASSGSQAIAKVQLVVDNQSVRTITAAPFKFTLPSLAAGSHVLSIIATDIAALSSVSTPVVVTAEDTTTATPAFFTGETALSNGVYYLAFPSGNFFGYYSFLPNPAYLFHFDLGFEYVFDAADGKSGVYFYDFASSTFFYTSPTFPFPYLYDFSLNSVLYYYPDPNNAGHYNTEGIRYFFDFNSQQIISK